MNIDRTTPTVGKLLTGVEGRDAIHFALAPVCAVERLMPNQKVVLVGDIRHVRAVHTGEIAIGRIDPFLEVDFVEEGQYCWLFLMPNTITGLRHVWQHSAFKTEIPIKEKNT